MGIISDFLNMKQAIEENRKFGGPGPVSKLVYSMNKRKLGEIADKLILANEPLPKDEILELAQSLHGISVGYDDGFYDDKVKVEYFPGNESYRLSLFSDRLKKKNIELFEIIVSSKNKEMEVSISIRESKEIIRRHRLNMPVIHTNIKELEDFIDICNQELYLLMNFYLYDIIAEKPKT